MCFVHDEWGEVLFYLWYISRPIRQMASALLHHYQPRARSGCANPILLNFSGVHWRRNLDSSWTGCAAKISCQRRINLYFTAWIPHWKRTALETYYRHFYENRVHKNDLGLISPSSRDTKRYRLFLYKPPLCKQPGLRSEVSSETTEIDVPDLSNPAKATEVTFQIQSSFSIEKSYIHVKFERKYRIVNHLWFWRLSGFPW